MSGKNFRLRTSGHNGANNSTGKTEEHAPNLVKVGPGDAAFTTDHAQVFYLKFPYPTCGDFYETLML